MTTDENKPPMNHNDAMSHIIGTLGNTLVSYEDAILAYVRLRGFLRDGAELFAQPPDDGNWAPESALIAIKRTLADHKAWLVEPNHDIATSIGLVATIAVANEITRGIELPPQAFQIVAPSVAEEIAAEHKRQKQARESLVRVAGAILGEIERLDVGIANGGEA